MLLTKIIVVYNKVNLVLLYIFVLQKCIFTTPLSVSSFRLQF